MNATYFVPFETAKQLKEKGYPQDKSDYRYFDIKFPADNFDCAAPTYHEVVDWLEGKGIILQCYSPILKQNLGQYTAGVFNSNTNDWGTCKSVYPTREEALNAAILKALKMI